MDLIPSFVQLVQPLAATMTAPTFQSLMTLITGWVFARRRTITQMILAAGPLANKHFSSYHRVFSAARWSLDAVGLVVFDLIKVFCGKVTMLAIDDTLARKRGLKMFGCAMHHDPLISSRAKAVMNWGHSWVVVGVIVKLPFRPGHSYCLPILFRMYLNQKKAKAYQRTYYTRPQLAVQMLEILCKHEKNRRFHAVADSAYGGQSVLNFLPLNCDLTSRLLMDARLHAALPPRKKGQKGRPRKRGERLASPQEMLQQRCRRVEFSIYGRTQKAQIADTQAHVYKSPTRPLRVVAVQPLDGNRPQVFYSTCHEASAEMVVEWYARRWSMEVTFHDSKQSLGFEQPQGWSRQAAERTAPMAMLLYSLIVLWFAQEGHRQFQPSNHAWYRCKTEPSFADMFVTLKQQSLRQQFFSQVLRGPGSRKIRQFLENTLALAA